MVSQRVGTRLSTRAHTHTHIIYAHTYEHVCIYTCILGVCVFAAAAKSLQSCLTLCDPRDGCPPGSPSLGFSRQELWSGLPFPSPMHESEKWKWSRSVVSHSSQPHGLQPTRLLNQWNFPGKNTRVGCHCLLHHLTLTLFKTNLLKTVINTCCLSFLRNYLLFRLDQSDGHPQAWPVTYHLAYSCQGCL